MQEALKYWPLALVQSIAATAILLLLAPSSFAEEIYRTGIESRHYVQPTNNEPAYQTGVEQNQQSDMGIIGVEFSIPRSGQPIVRDVYPGTSGFYAGIQPGDKIITINGLPAKNMGLAEVDNAISEIPGDTVSFLIDHRGQLTMKAVVVMPLSTVMSANLKTKYSTTSFAASLSKVQNISRDW